MAKPPSGVDDVFAATMVLLAGVSPSVVTTKAGKVKDRSWDACKKQLLGESHFALHGGGVWLVAQAPRYMACLVFLSASEDLRKGPVTVLH